MPNAARAQREWEARRDAHRAPSGAGFEQPAAEAPKATPPAADESKARAILVSAADVHPESIGWLWQGRVPRGGISVLEGPPGLGKTTVALDLVARVSSGAPMPGESTGREPATVIVASLEDSLAATIVPRLKAAGADLRRVLLLEGVGRKISEASPLSLPDHLAELEVAIRTHDAVLVVVDPLMAALSGKVDSYRDQDVRVVLSKLRSIAENTGCAIIIIRHLRKAPGLEAISAGQGSIGIAAAARSVLLLARHPSTAAECVLAHVKCNVAQLAPAQRVRTVSTAVGEGISTSRLEWLGDAPGITADQLVVRPPQDKAEDKSALAEAKAFLRDRLSDGEKHASKQVQDEAREVGISPKTFHRARKELQIIAKQVTDPKTKKRAWFLRWTGPSDGQDGHVQETWPSDPDPVVDPKEDHGPASDGQTANHSDGQDGGWPPESAPQRRPPEPAAPTARAGGCPCGGKVILEDYEGSRTCARCSRELFLDPAVALQ